MAALPRRLRADGACRRGCGLAPPLRQHRLEDGTPVLHFDEIDSTNAEAGRRASAGKPAPFWVVADRQTAGRARRGRDWSSLEGNLFASYVCRPGFTPERAALSTFATSLAVADTVSSFLPDGAARVALKWPNDVLVGGRKLAGVLIERVAGKVVVGVGLNVHRPAGGWPGEIEGVAAALDELGAVGLVGAVGVVGPMHRLAVVRELIAGLEGMAVGGAGADPGVVDFWRKRCVQLGRRLVLLSDGREVRGEV
ncbi:MAG: biotin--[acetyl-CoA-carboxylase] ligase, partial [Pseudomonadota bacterium]